MVNNGNIDMMFMQSLRTTLKGLSRMGEPDIEPENRTICSHTNGGHDWEWNENRDDWLCVLCNVWHEYQEDEDITELDDE